MEKDKMDKKVYETKDVDTVDVKPNHINKTNTCETMYLDEFWKKYKMSEHVWELV